jgi:hypothetical protein
MVRLEGLGKFKKFNNLIGTRTRNLPACSIAPRKYIRVRIETRKKKTVQNTNTSNMSLTETAEMRL